MTIQESSIRVGVDSRGAERGADRAGRALNRLGRRAGATEAQFDRLQGSLGGFSSIMAGLSFGVAISGFTRLLDVVTTIDTRLRLVTNTQQELNAVYDELNAISNRTNSSLESTARVFGRLATATQNMGLTYRQQLDLVEQLNMAMIISGTTAQEGAGALRQLGQALGAGALMGDEFVSINENLPRVMQAVADKMGVQRGELKALSRQGKITARVIVEAMKDAAPELAEQFAEVNLTIESAFVVLQNRLLAFVREVNNATGVGATLADGILVLANNFNTLVGAIAGLATVITGRLIMALTSMTVALATNPIGAILVLIGSLSVAMGYLADQTFAFGEATVTGWQMARAAVQTAYEVFVDVFNFLKEVFRGYEQDLSGFVGTTFQKLQDWVRSWGISLSAIADLVKAYVNRLVGSYVAAFKSVQDVWRALPALFEFLLKATANLVAEGMENVVNLFVSGLSKIGQAVDAFAGTDLAGKINRSLTVDLGRLNTDEASAALALAGSRISQNFNEHLNFDYVGAAGSALEDFTNNISRRFNENLREIIATDEAAASAVDLLNNKFKENTEAASANADALKKLAKERQSFISSLESEYNLLREATGQAAVVAAEQYAAQSETLKKLGLEHTKYAGMLEQVYQERLREARIQDVENAQAWAAGLTAAQRSVAESIQTEWQTIQEANGRALESVQRWHTQQKALLEAAGLEHTVYADKLDEVFQDRIAEARRRDLENADDWASGVQRAILKMSENMGTEADMMEDVVTGAFGKMEQALSDFVKTGKLDFKSLAHSIASDIMMITAKMLVLKALKSVMGGGLGFSEGGAVKMASGGQIKGPGTGTSDSIPARLSDGEFVVNAKQTAKYFDLLKAVNDDRVPDFSTGGAVAKQPSLMREDQPTVPLSERRTTQNGQKNKDGGADSPKNDPNPVNVRVINVVDPKESLAALDTAEGEMVIMNVIERNPGTLRQILGAA